MIYAIATLDKKLSPHFSKTQSFTFFNELEMIAVYKNPILGVSGCAPKGGLIALFSKMKCDVVIIRKIGENSLARLLTAGFKVEQGNTRKNYQELIADARLHKNSLTSPEQGSHKKCGGSGRGSL
jgi:predicted Fe-Mo cluster-binding NifX family protein